MITSCRFSEIAVEDQRYIPGVLVLPDGDRNWRQAWSHEVDRSNLNEAIRRGKPEVVVAGGGDSEMMALPPQTLRRMESQDIEVMFEDNGKVRSIFGEFYRSWKVMAALHLTC